MKKVTAIFGILLIVMLCSYVSASEADRALLEMILFPEAENIVRDHLSTLQVTSTAYKIKSRYPSIKVLKYYDKKLGMLGWHASKEDDRHWIRSIHVTKRGKPFVHQLSAYWHDRERTKYVHLLLRYFSSYPSGNKNLYMEEPSSDLLDVSVSIGPYIGLSDK